MKKILFALLSLNVVFAGAQINSPQIKYNIIPPSPEASSLGKYGDVPVNLYSGSCSIGVPLVTLESSLLSTPLSLSYDSKGLRVNDFASRVGMGWTLTAGGVITRTTVGKPDESPAGFYQFGSTIPANLNNSTEPATVWLKQAFEQGHDTEADMYFFNFGGRSGKFMRFGSEFRTVPYSKLSIEETGSGGNGFIVKDEEGIRYHFAAVEWSSFISSTDDVETVANNSWYLTKIEDPGQKDSIVFQYDVHSYSLPTMLVSETKKWMNQVPVSNPSNMPEQVYNSVSFDQSFAGLLLKKISAANWKADLYYSSRTDLMDKKVDSIVISNNAERLKSFAFKYSYGGQKLFLDSLVESSDNAVFKRYSFEYDRKSEVPDVNSKAQDHWGYFNGANNSTLIPPFETYNGPVAGADREPNSLYSSVGILTKLTYPTGGYSLFEYEPNTYSRSTKSMPAKYLYTAEVGNALARYQNGQPQEVRDTIHISYPQKIRISTSISNCNPSLPGCQSPSHEPSDGVLRLTRASGGDPLIDKFGGYPDQVLSSVIYRDVDTGTYYLYASAPGLYDKCQISAGYKERMVDTAKMWLGGGLRIKSITNSDGVNVSNNQKRIYEYTLVDSPQRSSGIIMNLPVYEFGYRVYSTNTADNPPENGPSPVTPMCSNSFDYTIHTSTASNSLGTTGGGCIGYSMVTEKFVGGGTSYKIVHYFTAPDNPAYWDRLPYFGLFPATSMDFRRGLLLAKEFYNSNGTLIRRESKAYTFDSTNRKEILNLKLSQNTTCPASTLRPDGTYTPEAYNIGYYKYISEWNYLRADTTVEITPATNAVLQSINQYEYDTATLQISRVTTQDSKGNLNVSTVTYPQNYSIAPGTTNKMLLGIKALQDRHIMTKQIEVVKGGYLPGQGYTVNSAVLNSYDPDALEADTVLLANLLTTPNFTPFSLTQNSFTRDPHYYPKAISLFNNQRKLQEIYKDRDVHNTYLWGYNRQYPVAMVVGSNLATVSSFVDQNVLDNPSSDAALRTELNKIRTGLASATVMVTTCTYKPLIGMTSQTDPTGKTIYHEYDLFGRLSVVRDQDNNVIKRNCYGYRGNPESCPVLTNPLQGQVGNQAQSADFLRSNSTCSSGQVGGTYTYTIPANTYYAADQLSANNLAIAALYANGQAQANANAPCSVPPTIYAQLSYENISYQYSGTYADVVVRFYSDYNCTVPFNVNSLTVGYSAQDNCGSTSSYNQMVSGDYAVLASGATLEYQYYNYGYYYQYCNVDYYLDALTGYTIVN